MIRKNNKVCNEKILKEIIMDEKKENFFAIAKKIAAKDSSGKLGKWVNISADKMSSLSPDKMEALKSVLIEEVGGIKLDLEARENFQDRLGVSDGTADKWRTAKDVLKHLDTVEFAKNHPSETKTAVSTILNVLSFAFPAVGIAASAYAKLPDELAAKLIEIGGVATPEHIAHKLAEGQEKKELTKADIKKEILAENEEAQALIESESRQKLIIVSKTDILSDYMKKLVYTKDDTEGEIVGIADGSVEAILWNENFYQLQKECNNIRNKLLIIGDVKGTGTLTDIIDVKFNRFGVEYGWANDQLIIYADAKKLTNKEMYSEFLKELAKLPVPEKLKVNSKMKLDAGTVGKAAILPPLLIKDYFDQNVMIKKQQLAYGLYNLYINHLEEFMKA